jgi:hypothetical protein
MQEKLIKANLSCFNKNIFDRQRKYFYYIMIDRMLVDACIFLRNVSQN